jgi:oligopeptide transport system permease protein
MNESSSMTKNAVATVAVPRKWFSHPTVAISVIALAFILLFIGVWPWLSPYGPETLSEAQFQPPSAEHWLGTDVHGRDLLSRIVFGARISLVVGTVGTLVSLIIGVTWGGLAGYLGGRWDNVLMRVVDILYTLPSIIFVIVLITTLETFLKRWLVSLSPQWASHARMFFLFIGLGAVSWLTMARIVRGQVLALRNRGFVEASRALGASHARIFLRHILPNIFGVVVVYLTLTLPSVILSESFLSYLGLGIQAPQASLGLLIAEGARQLNPIRVYWWLLVFPGGFLVVTLLAFNLLGDALRQAWDTGGSNAGNR